MMTDDDSPKKEITHKRSFALLILIVNIVLIATAAILYGRYTAVYQERLREENLGNIANLNQSAATNATAMIGSWSTKLEDTAQFVERRRLTLEETLTLLDDANASEDRQLELIGANYSGYLARRDETGAFIAVTYQGGSYVEMKKVIDGTDVSSEGNVSFVPEFTDNYSALKCFAIYKRLQIRDANGNTEPYTLMLAGKSRDVLAVFNNQLGFTGMSSVLVDAKGAYIVSNSDFKSDNFFKYLYVYNDLTLDERSEIQHRMVTNSSGELYYQNSIGQDCVFRYSKMSTNDWYCITCVPLSSFRTPVFNANYAVYAVLALVLMFIVDMFWLRNMNVRLRVSMQRAEEAGEAKTDFLSRMSHDIRTPLNGIIGMTLLAADEPNPPRTAAYLKDIKASGNFLLGLVNDILDISKVESGKMELHPEPYTGTEFRQYIEAVIAPLCREKDQTFRVNAPANDQAVMFDRLRLNQIFCNLLSNAVKYTPAEGTVELSWLRSRLSDTRMSFDFTVRDNGIGMSEEYQQRMFESFTQEHADSSSTGSGLGLSIVWNLVHLMGGRISVESKLGEGSAFHVHLEADICEEQPQRPDAFANVELTGRRMLLCEDNRVNIIIARGMLEKWGIAVEVAENGKIGVDKFAASPIDSFDAILMDIRMPEMNGLDATRAIRKLERPDAATVPIVAMTANAYDIDVQNCLEAGMNAHLGKPIQPELLQSMLIQQVARSSNKNCDV